MQEREGLRSHIKFILFSTASFFLGFWPFTIFAELVEEDLHEWYTENFRKPSVDHLMNLVFSSQHQAPPSPFIEISAKLMNVPGFISQLHTYAHVDGLCGVAQPSPDNSTYVLCLLKKHHSQPHFVPDHGWLPPESWVAESPPGQ